MPFGLPDEDFIARWIVDFADEAGCDNPGELFYAMLCRSCPEWSDEAPPEQIWRELLDWVARNRVAMDERRDELAEARAMRDVQRTMKERGTRLERTAGPEGQYLYQEVPLDE